MYRQSERNLLNSNISSRCPPQYGELRPNNSWDRLAGLGHPRKFQRISCLGFVTTPEPISAASRPKFTILLLNKFFPIVDMCLSCEDIAQQSCAMVPSWRFLWPPCVADIIFLPCGFFLLSSFFIPRLISAVADWMSTILLHMVWP